MASTAVQNFTNILLNDDASVSSVISIGGIAIAPAGSSAYAAPGGGTFTVASDGTASFDPASDFQYLRLGSMATSSAIYVTDIGSSARLTVAVAGSLEVAYSLAPEDGGTSLAGDPTGALTEGTTVSLAADTPAYSIDAAVVGAVTRMGGAAGSAKLTFASDAAYIGYDYLEDPAIYLFGFALGILIPSGTTAGRIAETVATNGGGYLLEVVGSNLMLTVDDGAGTVLTASRSLTGLYDTPITVATALSPYGLLLALSGDDAAAVTTVAATGYAPPNAQTLKIGGAGAEIYGGSLFHPYALTEAGLVALMDEVSASYGGASVDEVASSAGIVFTDIVDPIDGFTYRLAAMPTGSSIVFARDAAAEYQLIGGGGGGGESYGGQSGAGGGAGRFLKIYGPVLAGTYTATVGAGGARAHLSAGSNGGDTFLTGASGEIARAIGGGGGGRGAGSTTQTGLDGGSGGGGGYGGTPLTPAGLALAGVGVGFDGGLGGNNEPTEHVGGGGGGGAGQVGYDGNAASKAGCGGDGVMSTITGAEVCYGGGGGGGRVLYGDAFLPTAGAGGLGGGARGHQANTNSVASGDAGTNAAGVARPGSGGGGGGGSRWNGTATAGATGSIYIRWRR